MSPRDGETITRILRTRCGQWTLVTLTGGRHLRVFDIAWGRDMGDDFDHLTTNISPGPPEEHTVDFFFNSEVVDVTDPVTGERLFINESDV
jgi:hypothetical protein